MLANTYAQVLQFIQSYGAVAALIAVMIVGILRIFSRYVAARKHARAARAFRDRFHTFSNSSGEDTEAYERLSFLAERMANTMGRYALVDAKPPFSGHSTKSFENVLQFIPELRMHFNNLRQGGYGLGNDGSGWIYHSVDDALIRFLGSRDETAKLAARKLVNPVAWFREGVERILALPLYVLSGFGMMEPTAAATTEQNGGFRALAGLVSIVAVVSIASTLIFGEQKTATAYRSIGNTAASAVSGAATAVVSAFSDAKKVITTPKQQ